MLILQVRNEIALTYCSVFQTDQIITIINPLVKLSTPKNDEKIIFAYPDKLKSYNIKLEFGDNSKVQFEPNNIEFPLFQYKLNCAINSISEIGKPITIKKSEEDQFVDVCGIIRMDTINLTELTFGKKILDFYIVDCSNYTVKLSIWNSHVNRFFNYLFILLN